MRWTYSSTRAIGDGFFLADCATFASMYFALPDLVVSWCFRGMPQYSVCAQVVDIALGTIRYPGVSACIYWTMRLQSERLGVRQSTSQDIVRVCAVTLHVFSMQSFVHIVRTDSIKDGPEAGQMCPNSRGYSSLFLCAVLDSVMWIWTEHPGRRRVHWTWRCHKWTRRCCARGVFLGTLLWHRILLIISFFSPSLAVVSIFLGILIAVMLPSSSIQRLHDRFVAS